MPARNVPRLVREDADKLVWRFRFGDRADMEEHVLAVDHEGVERFVVHDVDIDVLLGQIRRPEDRRGVGGQQILDLSVADQAGRETARSLDEQQRQGRDADG